MSRSIASLLVGIAIGLALSPPPAAADGARVESFSPTGFVKAPRQVAVRFSAAMVALGDPRPSAPFSVECGEKGVGRWLDTRRWVFDFEREVPAGVRCRFRSRPDLRTLSGASITAAAFEFHTGGPQVEQSQPFAGSDEIEEEQAFALFLDAEATRESVERHVFFAVAGIREPIAARLVSDPERDAIATTFYPDRRDKPVVIVRAQRRFPNGAKVKLVWDKGVESTSGLATELRQSFDFVVRPPFRAELRCSRVNPKADCIPLLPLHVDFTAPVPWFYARNLALVAGERRFPAAAVEEREGSTSTIKFVGPFPESQALELRLEGELRDDAGRLLGNAASFPMTVKTDVYPPLAKFSSRFGIIEAAEDPALPVTLRNIEAELKLGTLQLTAERDASFEAKFSRFTGRLTGRVERLPTDRLDWIQPWLRRVAGADHSRSIFVADDGKPEGTPAAVTLPKPGRESAFEVVGIPFEKPGLYLVEIESPRLGAALLGTDKNFYVPTAALVTNLAVHFKQGPRNALVWVTALDDAAPVAHAEVTIQDCKGTELWRGVTDGSGLARVAELPASDRLPTCEDESSRAWSWSRDSASLDGLTGGLLVVARTHEDLSFTHSSWQDGIEAWRFGVPTDYWSNDEIVAHTVFDRPMYRTGETVSMKHILRRRTLTGFEAPNDAEKPAAAVIEHVGSEQKFVAALTVDASGTATGEWKIPADAKLGQYNVTLRSDEFHSWHSGSFRVSAFRVPLMKADLGLPASIPPGSSAAAVDLSAVYLSGGAAKGLPVTLRTQVRSKPFTAAPPFDGYRFGAGGVTPGISRRGAWDDWDGDSDRQAAAATLQKSEAVLGDAGTVRITATGLPSVTAPSELLAEMEFRDPNGETQTVAATARLWPARWLTGIDVDSWVRADGAVAARIAVVDTAGKPVAKAPVRVEVFRRSTFSSRKRLAGGFYGYESGTEISGPIATFCEGSTSANGILACTASAPGDGELVLQATVVDPEGHSATTHASVWVAGGDDWWFDAQPGDRMDIIPERHRYEPGETARIQVRMPFAKATALVTVERDGVLDARVARISGKQPVVQVPISGDYAPNAFISVLAVRGRVGGVQPTARLDLGKPAFRLGLTEVLVGWRAHQLDVSVRPERETYKVRESAEVEIEVRTADGRPLPPDTEVAVAAVDAGLLELAPNRSWEVLDAFMGRRSYRVRTASAQLQVVGKRHFGLKSLPTGGGGGRQNTRELFDTLLLWEPRVGLDERGRARVRVPLNDSLTSFRIAAVAVGGSSAFGTGGATIRATQDLMILPGLAPLVRNGDLIRNEVTVRNATERDVTVTVGARAAELSQPLTDQQRTIAAGAAEVVAWDIAVPTDTQRLSFEFAATADDGATDTVRVHQRVAPAVPTTVLQATLAQVRGELRTAIAAPRDALAGAGGIAIALAPSLLVALDGPREWLAGYAYTCLEQRVSIAIGRDDEAAWSQLSGELPTYADADGLLKYFPQNHRGSDVLTAYVLDLSAAAGRPLPDAIKRSAAEALRRFVEGRLVVAHGFDGASLGIRKLAALAALARVGEADPALLDSLAIEPQLWPDNALVDWLSVLHHLPEARGRDARLKEVEAVLRGRLVAQGANLGFGDSVPLWWLMAGRDLPALRLVVTLVDAGWWQSDLPPLMLGALGRMRNGSWSTTVENAWGTLALRRFATRFESKGVTGTTTAKLAAHAASVSWSDAAPSHEMLLGWPDGRDSLLLEHEGSGAPWATVRARAAIALREPLFAGYHLRKTLIPVAQRTPGVWSRGDVLRVRLEVDASRAMPWIVVDDPIPAGASHLGGNNLRESTLATSGEGESDWWNRPSFVERSAESWRAYYEFGGDGSFSVEHTLRLNQSGTFQIPPTRVEALYNPEMFAQLPNDTIVVAP